MNAIDTRAFALSAGATAAVLFSLCAVGVFLAPGTTTRFLGVIAHLDLTGVARPLTLMSYVVGLLTWTLGTGVTFGLVGWIYNRLAIPPLRPPTEKQGMSRG